MLKKLFRDGYMSIRKDEVKGYLEDELRDLEKISSSYTAIYFVVKAVVDIKADSAEYSPFSSIAYRSLSDAILELTNAVNRDCEMNESGYVKIDIYERAVMVTIKNTNSNICNSYKILSLKL